jgi:hypothetical protein
MLGVRVQSALGQARQQLFDAFARDVHFTGCAIGLRRRDGQVTDEPVVVAMVTKKLPAGAVSRSRLMPATIAADGHNWGVDVVEVRSLTTAPLRGSGWPDGASEVQGVPITQQKLRPPLQGCSVSDATGPIGDTGTLGCLVRDSTDGTICILGTNSVLAQSGKAALGEHVIQPGGFDGGTSSDKIATLKRYVPFTTSGQNFVDAAIAQLDSQKGYSQKVAGDLMKPISATHRVVGVCVAGDSEGLNCFLSPMSQVVSAIGVELLPATSGSSCIVAPEVGMHMEKVGRTTPYTASIVDAVGAQIKVYDSDSKQTLVFANMIWSQAFFLPGDNGAVACEGGNGRTFVPPPPSPCPLLASVGHYFHLPLTKDNPVTNQLKTQFLAQSLVGNLIIGLTYDNSQTVIDRVKGKQAPGIEQSYAETYYKKYLSLVKAALAHPASKTRVVTEGNLNDFQFILAGLSGAGGAPVLTPAESQALSTIYSDVLVHTKGMDFDRLVSYMNEVAVWEKVVKALQKVKTVKLTGTITNEPLG